MQWFYGANPTEEVEALGYYAVQIRKGISVRYTVWIWFKYPNMYEPKPDYGPNPEYVYHWGTTQEEEEKYEVIKYCKLPDDT